ncbi:MAG: hypothetical protein M3021_02110 [Actinomycetota bacterium]|nr:hypothetical protein [Actinomycetota bacterium]
MIRTSEETDSGSTERLRLGALKNLRLMDTPAVERFDRITRTARELFGGRSAGAPRSSNLRRQVRPLWQERLDSLP